MNTYAVDFESYYDEEVSIITLGVDLYLRKTDIYLVSIVGDDGFEWVGHPSEAPWDKIDGHVWLSHNRSFDGRVYQYLSTKHPQVYKARAKEWHCTSDMAAFYGLPRNLADACEFLLGIKVDKTIRDNMKGRSWESLSEEERNAVKEYALIDGRRCLQLWQKASKGWPKHERELSMLTSEMGWNGVYIDIEKVEEGIKRLERVMWEAENQIPWAGEGEKILSAKNLALACREAGIEPPASLAKDSEECAAWEDKYGAQFPWVAAMRNYRRANILKLKLETMRDRRRPEDGRMGFSLKYFGAALTGRWSGDGGFNIQNIHKDVMWDINVRHLIKAAPGKKFIIADLSQIEPRCLAWLVGDEPFLDGCRAGVSPYEVHARTSMGYKGDEALKRANPKMYALAKARVLSLGYGAGWEKFIAMATMYGALEAFEEPVSEQDSKNFRDYLCSLASKAGANQTKYAALVKEFDGMTPEARRVWVNSWLQVNDFRKTNPKIAGEKGIWKSLDRDARASIGGTYTIELPSGRSLTYRNVSGNGGLSAMVCKNGVWTRVRLYGGLLTENLVQATARDVFGFIKLELLKAGLPTPVMTVHDELVFEVDKNVEPEEIEAIMKTAPPWMEGLPLDTDILETDCYTK